jgi:hypothetical protein
VLKDYILIAAGGGGKAYGVRNKVLSFRVNNNTISDQVYQDEFEKEIPVFVGSHEPLDVFVVCVDNYCVFYKLNPNDGTFKQLNKLQTMDYSDLSSYVTICKFDDKGEYVATGTSDGLLK